MALERLRPAYLLELPHAGKGKSTASGLADGRPDADDSLGGRSPYRPPGAATTKLGSGWDLWGLLVSRLRPGLCDLAL